VTANLLGINSKKPIQATVKTATMKLGVTSASPLSFAQELKTVLLTSRVEATLTLAAAQIDGYTSTIKPLDTIPQGLLAQN
jgi:hypothetical protein